MDKAELRELISDVLYSHIDDEETAESILDSIIERMDEEGLISDA